MSFFAGEIFEDVASLLGKWGMEEKAEVLRVWNREGGAW